MGQPNNHHVIISYSLIELICRYKRRKIQKCVNDCFGTFQVFLDCPTLSFMSNAVRAYVSWVMPINLLLTKIHYISNKKIWEVYIKARGDCFWTSFSSLFDFPPLIDFIYPFSPNSILSFSSNLLNLYLVSKESILRFSNQGEQETAKMRLILSWNTTHFNVRNFISAVFGLSVLQN